LVFETIQCAPEKADEGVEYFRKKAWLEVCYSFCCAAALAITSQAIRCFTYALGALPPDDDRAAAALLAKRGATAANLGCPLRCALDGEAAIALNPGLEWAYAVASQGRWRRGELLRMARWMAKLRERNPASPFLEGIEAKMSPLLRDHSGTLTVPS